MSTQSLVITYAASQAFVDPYWVRIDQDAVVDAATVGQTAAVLDALYQLDPCVPSDDPAEPVEPVEPEEATEKVAEVLDLPACNMEPDGSVEVDIRVYRSHLAEPYVLRLRGGTAVKTVQESGSVTFSGEISETVTLEAPVVSGFTCNPAPLSRKGNTMRFAASQVGKIYRASYQSQWDRVTVKVFGVNGEPGECSALAFHHGVAAAHDLELPEIAEIDRSLCPTVRWAFETDYDVTCYKDVIVTRRCSCSGDKVDQRTEQQIVPCPNPDMQCPNNQTRCMHLLGTETLDEWIECAGDAEIPGHPGRNYALSTPEFYREMCCKEPEGQLPQCPVKRTTYKAELPIEMGQDYWRGMYGPATRFVPVPPAGGICGEWIVEQSLNSGCCTEIPAPVWDAENSVEVMSDNSEGLVYWSKSLAPYTVRIEGTGFWLAGSKKVRDTSDEYIRIYTTAACGSCTVTVEDACGKIVTGSVRSVNGKWVQVEFIGNTLSHGCQSINYGTYGVSCYQTTIQGAYKVMKRTYACFASCGGVVAPAYWACPNQGVRTDPCLAIYGSASMTTNRPTLGHDPGNCTPDADCRQNFLDGQLAYCHHFVAYPGQQWTVWEWQC